MERVGRRTGAGALLILYAVGVSVLVVVGLWRQALLVRQLRHGRAGDLGVTVSSEARAGTSFEVTGVVRGTPAADVLRAGDRILDVAGCRLFFLAPTRRLFALPETVSGPGAESGPPRVLVLRYVRAGREYRRPLLLVPHGGGSLREPESPLGLWLFGGLLPVWLTLWGFLAVGWVVLARRFAGGEARLFALLMMTVALAFSYALTPPWLYPQPLRGLAEHNVAVTAWIASLAVHFSLVTPEEKPFFRRFRHPLTVAIYLPALVVAALAVRATLQPEARSVFAWVERWFGLGYWVPAFLLVAAGLLHGAIRASTPAGRRQARTVLLAMLPFLVFTVFEQSAAALRGEPLGAHYPPVAVAQSLATLIIPVGLAYAILRQGMLDLGLVLRRGLLYGAVLAAGVAGYYLVILTTGRLLLELTGEPSPLATMVATLALVAVLRPIGMQFRRWIDQAFYRDRLETARRLRAMSQEILSLLDRDALLALLTARLPALFPTERAALFLYDPAEGVYRRADAADAAVLSAAESLIVRRLEKSGRPVATYDIGSGAPGALLAISDQEAARRLEAVLWVPLLLRGSLIGILALGWKVSEEIYTEEEIEALSLIAREAAVALENAALSEEREQQARLQQEVAIARAIQMRLLPPRRLQVPGFEILSRSEPATEVGGDFYNLFEVAGSTVKVLGSKLPDASAFNLEPSNLPPAEGACLDVLLGDVSGKGVPGALFMAVTTTLIEAQARLLESPAATLAAANAELYPKMRQSADGQPPMFVTALYGVLDAAQGKMRLANAGQTLPIHWPASEPPRYVRLTGVPLGAFPASTYEETVLRLQPGDRLLFCSDGFIEERDASGEAVGYEGFLRRLEALAASSGPELIEALFDDRSAAEDEGAEPDDRTLVLIMALAGAGTQE